MLEVPNKYCIHDDGDLISTKLEFSGGKPLQSTMHIPPNSDSDRDYQYSEQFDQSDQRRVLILLVHVHLLNKQLDRDNQ